MAVVEEVNPTGATVEIQMVQTMSLNVTISYRGDR